ncbi:MAG: 4Fe-4S dicluster domain-containing protein, partial [Acidimicrobiia bacterium]|nr:4Fe-4S dicluster domain-containing protein [Acidimicrobiia bacterium]
MTESGPSAPSATAVGPMMLDVYGLEAILRGLRDAGRTVIGPVVRDGVITHDEIERIADLPIGWTDDQDGGRYAAVRTGTDELFAFSSPATSWKRYVYPERTLLITAKRSQDAVTVTEAQPAAPHLAFFGIRSCDLAALSVLDRVFIDGDATDPHYRSRRNDVFIVAAGCGHPGRTCFCASMDTGPSPRSGFDLAVAELHDDRRHEFLVTPGSDRGHALLRNIGGRPATAADREAVGLVNDRAVAAMGRTLRPEDPPLAAQHLDHPRWDDVAERCLACGNCTMACPTCFCGTTEEVTNLGGDEAQRWRVWDSCFTLDFTHLPDGAVRA